MSAAKRHPHNALSALTVRALTKPGRYADGNGLYLLVDPSGAKRWVLRTVVQRRRTDIGLGSVRLVTLAEAREKALELRKVARQGGDPLAERRRAREGVPTFERCARDAHAAREESWRNSKHAAQWITTLERYVFPDLGGRPVNTIGTRDIQDVLEPIWHAKPETARRVAQRIRTVIAWASAKEYYVGDNPVDRLRALKALAKQNERARHHAALEHGRVARFIQDLHGTDVIGAGAKLAFELMILTATRTSELLLARPVEFDLEARTWTIPADRMKAKRAHVVPLPVRAVEIVREASEIAGASAAYLFPGRDADKPLSNMVFLMALRRMGVPITAHGFRSSFRDWAAECTHYPRELAELGLAHVINDKTQAAYQRSELLERRRALMADWATYCAKPLAEVLELRREGAKTAA